MVRPIQLENFGVEHSMKHQLYLDFFKYRIQHPDTVEERLIVETTIKLLRISQAIVISFCYQTLNKFYF